MPIPISDALQGSASLATMKGREVQRLPRYLISSALAGLFVGVAVVLLLSTAGPLAAAGEPSAKLVGAAVFGIALTLVVFAGGELFTGNVMYMAHGLSAGTVRAREVAAVCAASLVGNLAGSVGFSAMVTASGSISAGGTVDQPSPALALLSSMVDGKVASTDAQLFWRAVLCNMLVCLSLWMAARAATDGAKLVVLWWGLLAFIAAGFEHSIANMTIFSLAGFAGLPGWQDVARNLIWTISGNIVGGGVFVGLAYAWIGSTSPAPAPRDHDAHDPPPPMEQGTPRPHRPVAHTP